MWRGNNTNPTKRFLRYWSEASITDTKIRKRHKKTTSIPCEYTCNHSKQKLANWIQQFNKRTIYDQMGFIPGMQHWFTLKINVITIKKKKSKKSYMIISVHRKTIPKFNVHSKNSQKIKNKTEFLLTDQRHLLKNSIII